MAKSNERIINKLVPHIYYIQTMILFDIYFYYCEKTINYIVVPISSIDFFIPKTLQKNKNHDSHAAAAIYKSMMIFLYYRKLAV